MATQDREQKPDPVEAAIDKDKSWVTVQKKVFSRGPLSWLLCVPLLLRLPPNMSPDFYEVVQCALVRKDVED
jgi:hypothetical protein